MELSLRDVDMTIGARPLLATCGFFTQVAGAAEFKTTNSKRPHSAAGFDSEAVE